MGVAREAGFGGHEAAGSAEAALRGVVIHEGLLEGVELAVVFGPSTVWMDLPSIHAANWLQE